MELGMGSKTGTKCVLSVWMGIRTTLYPPVNISLRADESRPNQIRRCASHAYTAKIRNDGRAGAYSRLNAPINIEQRSKKLVVSRCTGVAPHART